MKYSSCKTNDRHSPILSYMHRIFTPGLLFTWFDFIISIDLSMLCILFTDIEITDSGEQTLDGIIYFRVVLNSAVIVVAGFFFPSFRLRLQHRSPSPNSRNHHSPEDSDGVSRHRLVPISPTFYISHSQMITGSRLRLNWNMLLKCVAIDTQCR